MSSVETLPVIGSRSSRARKKARRLATAHVVVLCGQSLIDNSSLADRLEERGYRVVRARSLRDASLQVERDPAVIALIEASAPVQSDALEMIRALDPRCRRRVLAIVWRAARRLARQFIEAGVGDFVLLPAASSELLLRVELRAREARGCIFAERSELRGTLPAVNHLSGVFGPESSNVRLSDREFLLYDMLSHRFGTVVPRSEILSRIWGRDAEREPGSNIVDVYVRYLRVKLAKVSPALVITTVRHVGYVLERRED
jgi:DNA-binding response OmpR family regulator